MHRLSSFCSVSAIVFLAACGSSAALRAPASLWVDPVRDVVIVPPDICPRFGGWIAMTQDAVRLEELQRVESDAQHALDLARCRGVAEAADARAQSALKAAASSDWWSRYGFVLGLSAGVIAGGAAALTGTLLVQRLRFVSRRFCHHALCFQGASL